LFALEIQNKFIIRDYYKMSSVKVSKSTKKVKVTKTEEVEAPTPVPAPVPEPVSAPESTEQTPVVESSTEAVAETVRSRLEKLLHDLEEEKKTLTERIAFVKASMKMYDVEMKAKVGKRKVKRVVDPNRPVSKNGIAKPQVISDELATFLFKYYKIAKGSLVSRTQALSKENGLSKYITEKGLRRDGEIHPDSELIKLLGQPQDLSKDGKTKVFYHKTIMKLIGKHFPKQT
jgi:hypothetical protein